MANRLKLQNDLVQILGSNNVYYQPPMTLVMKYPCIRYELSKINTECANDETYIMYSRYQITLISNKPLEDMCAKILTQLPKTFMERAYVSDNLYHYCFSHYE